MDDRQKLIAYAKEVKLMLEFQQQYFKTSKAEKARQATVQDVHAAFKISVDQEKRVKQLTEKVLTPQMEIPG